ncbi:hypothetical protein BDN72DRAFT_899185 [Pluteus cervinus]|uniref:Uncharacterized protein n=1 Tax=Pluteus cervinus TaxID=181527 RepID=A0ACD3ANN3_9AGAR|nr:hypothetical protein BDN72DRAFT_899185 [Pluteus cervinus]
MINQRFLAISLLVAPLVAFARPFTVVNQCSDAIDLYVSGQKQGTIQPNGNTNFTQPDEWSGFIYTDQYGGSSDGTGTTRAGFYGTNDWYYLVVDTTHFNTAVTISTNGTQFKGYCLPDTCVTGSCANAFTTPPTGFGDRGPTAPSPPLYECPLGDYGFTVTFCPGGNTTPPPTFNSTTLHPGGSIVKCLDVRGAVYENGTPVQVYDCNGTGAQRWVVNKGESKVRVDNTNFCLDAGSAPGNGVGMKIWQCYDNLPAQDWWYTDDNRIALTNQGLCLDLTNGNYSNSNQIQTWQCTDNNNNQEWVSIS